MIVEKMTHDCFILVYRNELVHAFLDGCKPGAVVDHKGRTMGDFIEECYTDHCKRAEEETPQFVDFLIH